LFLYATFFKESYRKDDQGVYKSNDFKIIFVSYHHLKPSIDGLLRTGTRNFQLKRLKVLDSNCNKWNLNSVVVYEVSA